MVNVRPPYIMLLGMLQLLAFISSAVGAEEATSATTYFPNLTIDEKEEYTTWVNAHSTLYPRHTFMESEAGQDDGAAVFWNIDGDTIYVAAAVRAEGWVGFGISEAGGMRGADIALFEATKLTELIDAYVVEDRSMPLIDDCQDWTLEGATSENGWLIVEMSRLLDTKDNQDIAINQDADLWTPPTRFIVAWGDDDSVTYHGQKKARGSVRLFASHANHVSEMEHMINTLGSKSDGSFDVTEDEYEIPAESTYYHEMCVTKDDVDRSGWPEGQDMITMVGVMPIITEETKQFVHHFLVYLQKDCDDEDMQTAATQTLLYAWAPGDEGLALPDDVGFPIYSDHVIRIQIHYNNPNKIMGMKDSSGLRIYYDFEERAHEAGMLQVGDPWMSMLGENIGAGLTEYSFSCPGACSSSMLTAKERDGTNEGITVITEYLHMHETGVRMTHEVIRHDEVFHKAAVEVYDFDQQGNFHVPQASYNILPGDGFRTTCYYKDGTEFGLASSEEMCIAFIMYYPAKKFSFGMPWTCPFIPRDMPFLADCQQELSHSTLNSADEMKRNFGSSSGECTVDPSDIVSENIDIDLSEGNPAPAPAPVPKEESPTSANLDEEVPSGIGLCGVSLLWPNAILLLASLLA